MTAEMAQRGAALEKDATARGLALRERDQEEEVDIELEGSLFLVGCFA